MCCYGQSTHRKRDWIRQRRSGRRATCSSGSVSHRRATFPNDAELLASGLKPIRQSGAYGTALGGMEMDVVDRRGLAPELRRVVILDVVVLSVEQVEHADDAAQRGRKVVPGFRVQLQGRAGPG